MKRSNVAPAAVTAVLIALGTGACTGSGDDATDDSVPAAPVTSPPSRSSPFCEAMVDLEERLRTDPPDDTTALVIETYESLLPDVPDAIRPEFEYVLASLRGDPLPDLPSPTAPATTLPPATTVPPDTTQPPTTTEEADPDAAPTTAAPTTGPGVDEFILPDDTPAERLNDYVGFECQGTLNNPGPPATTPDVEFPDDDL